MIAQGLSASLLRTHVEGYEPGRSIRFRFIGSEGSHSLGLEEEAPRVVRLRHELVTDPKGVDRLVWAWVGRLASRSKPQGENSLTCFHSATLAPTSPPASKTSGSFPPSRRCAAVASPTGPAPITATGGRLQLRPSSILSPPSPQYRHLSIQAASNLI